MPTLDWIGKNAVVGHQRRVPYRLLHCDRERSAGDPDAGNLLVQGDNLEALKALLPYYAGQVKCIYIDPPYNTGNEGWVYNDNVTSPEIRRWLGEVVGKEAEDLSRHDKWLCMMYPRLALLKDFLREDGALFVSIDDNEGHYCKVLLDEVFGRGSFVATCIWQRLHARNNSAKHFSADHDFILVYAKDPERWTRNKVPRTEASDSDFWNPDDDPRKEWRRSDLTASKPYNDGKYKVSGPSGEEFEPRANRWWSISEATFEELRADNRLWWGKKGTTFPFRKRFRSELGELVPTTIWLNEDVGDNREAKQEINKLFGEEAFATPKPERLIQRILRIATDPGDLVLDSFAGSGTTGAVAHKMGRRWILVEMHDHSHTFIVPRMKTVVDGEQGGISRLLSWKGGGGFRFCRLGNPLFDEHGGIAEEVTFTDLAAHIFFTETGSPIPKRARKDSPILGSFEGRAIYLLYNGVLGDKRRDGGNVLTATLLAGLPPHPDKEGVRVVYGEGCRLGASRLKREGVIFKQVPYEVKVS
jgi:adenine specific DNA methylase Mod